MASSLGGAQPSSRFGGSTTALRRTGPRDCAGWSPSASGLTPRSWASMRKRRTAVTGREGSLAYFPPTNQRKVGKTRREPPIRDGGRVQ